MTQQTEAKPVESGEETNQQLLKMLVEIGPLVIFFTVNSLTKNIFYGTGAFMVATLAALVISRAWFGRIPVMPLVSGVFVLFFGGLTIWLQDAVFIKLKPTIVNTLFAVILLGGLAFGQSLLRHVFGEVFKLTSDGWRKLTFRWGLFFLLLAFLNEVVWRNFSEDFWLGFKMLGVMPMTAAFGVAQLGLLRRYAEPNKSESVVP
jgi:intracellular septation protein